MRIKFIPLYIVFGVATFILLIFFLFLPNLVYNYLSEFLAGTLGVLLGFSLERLQESSNEKIRGNRLLDDIKSELDWNYNRLTGKGILVKTTIWDSAVSSGLIQLLNSKQIEELSKIYFKMSGYQYEAIRTRDIGEHYRGLPEGQQKIQVAWQWQGASHNLESQEKGCKDAIKAILDDATIWRL